MADEQQPQIPEDAEGHAVPSEDAREIAGSAEDAALEAYEEAEEATTEAPPSAQDGEERTPEPEPEAVLGD